MKSSFLGIVPTASLFTFLVKDLEKVLLNVKSESAYKFEVFVDPKPYMIYGMIYGLGSAKTSIIYGLGSAKTSNS